MDSDRGCVLVGSDGSWRSHAVLDVAAQEASWRRRPLAVVSVVRAAADPRSSLTALMVDERRAADLAEWRLREAVSQVRARHPGLELSTHRVEDTGTGWPDEAAAGLPEATLLVVGAKGRGGEPVFGLGTVSRHLLKATACPVLVVPDSVPEPVARPGCEAGPVVAGVDDGAMAAPVLAASTDAAAARRAPVIAVHAYRALPGQDDAEAAELASRRLRALVHEAQHAPDVPGGVRVAPVVTAEPVVDALLERAAGASLLVVATRGPAALAGLSLESVSRAVLDDPPCPVLLLVPRSPRRSAGLPRPRARQADSEPAGT